MKKLLWASPLLCAPLICKAVVVGECQASLPEVDAAQCNNPSYYASYRAAADAAINQEHDERTTEVLQDNQANNETLNDETTVSLANFLQCQHDVCANYYDTCAREGGNEGGVSSRRFETNSTNCLAQAEQAWTIAKAQSKDAAIKNLNRKARTTVYEKVMAIGHRYKTITLTIADDLRKEMQTLASKVPTLVRETRDVPGRTLQSGPQ